MQTLTLYVGQGELIGIRNRGEAVIVDSRWPEEHAETIGRQLQAFLKNQEVAGLVLTGFDNDHADPYGIDYVLENYKPNWIMYPKYYKDTENATDVFKVISKHERRRRNTGKPLTDIPQMTSKFAGVVLAIHRHGNCVPFVALRCGDFGGLIKFGTPFGKVFHHLDAPLPSFSALR